MTTYTKKERKIICSVLKRAKAFVKTSEDIRNPTAGKIRAICFAIDLIPGLERNHNYLVTDMIADRLEPATFVEEWLSKNVPAYKKRHDSFDVTLPEDVQDYRHRWLDALIEEFSK